MYQGKFLSVVGHSKLSERLMRTAKIMQEYLLLTTIYYPETIFI